MDSETREDQSKDTSFAIPLLCWVGIVLFVYLLSPPYVLVLVNKVSPNTRIFLGETIYAPLAYYYDKFDFVQEFYDPQFAFVDSLLE